MLNIKRINKLFWWICTQLIMKREFRGIGKNAIIVSPLQIDYAKSIVIGEGVFIAKGGWLYGNKDRNVTLMIDQHTIIGHFCHIIAVENIKIEKSVLIADKVYISDCMHNYEDVTNPVLTQGIRTLRPIIIGEGAWIGENVCICGANIGKHCVIGANSVVTKDIPDYSVAVGSPAKVIKQYSFEKNKWVCVKK